MVQAYYDRTWRRDPPSTITDGLETYDLDFQHRLGVRKRHQVIWGGKYTLMSNETQHLTDFVGLLPPERNMELFSGFIHDEIALLSQRIRLIVGTKFHHHYFPSLK